MTELRPKKPMESAVIDNIYKVFPNDLNTNDTVFGGLVMSILDRTALVVAERHSGHTCVTASVDALHFLGPARKGDNLIVNASINRSWHTSMEIGLRVAAENYQNGEQTHIISAYFTLVAVNEQGRPTPVPAVTPETPIEKRRYHEADDRRNNRKQESATRLEKRQQYNL